MDLERQEAPDDEEPGLHVKRVRSHQAMSEE